MHERFILRVDEDGVADWLIFFQEIVVTIQRRMDQTNDEAVIARLAEQNWFDLYQPLRYPAEFEDQSIAVAELITVQDGDMVIASGSPRNPRFFRALGCPDNLYQMSLSKMQDRLQDWEVPAQYQTIWQRVMEYQEPKRAWTREGDGLVSEGKARMSLAALILVTLKDTGKIPASLAVLAKDFNVADCNGQFMDRPGYWMPQDRAMAERQNIVTTGWVYGDESDRPIEPLDQYVALYKNGQYFYMANSTVLLSADLSSIADDNENIIHFLLALVDLDSPLPERVIKREALSYMCLQPDESIIDRRAEWNIVNLLQFYMNLDLKSKGKLLYLIPGLVDWSRDPYLSLLKVWVADDGTVIHGSLAEQEAIVQQGQGRWVSIKDVIQQHPEVHDEMVGVSTASLLDLVA